MMIKKIIKNKIRYRCCLKLNLPSETGIYNIKYVKNVKCGHNCKILGISHINCLNIGNFSYISAGAHITKLKIGKFCSIASNLNMAIGEHPTTKFVSTYPAFFSINNAVVNPFVKKQKFEEFKYVDEDYHFVIGNDVWIGSNVILIEGHKIGDGAIIAAGSVVTKDIPPYEIWGGNPARFIKKRFSNEQIDCLLEMKWWDWPIEKIKKYSEYFENIETFIENEKQGKFKD